MVVKLVYTTHARLRMRQRGIGVRQIEVTVRSPDRVVRSFGGRLLVQRTIGSRQLEVIYRNAHLSAVIITAYWLAEGA